MDDTLQPECTVDIDIDERGVVLEDVSKITKVDKHKWHFVEKFSSSGMWKYEFICCCGTSLIITKTIKK